MKRDYLTMRDLSVDENAAIFRRAATLKAARRQHRVVNTLAGRTLVLIFEKASTRTRLSFEAAMLQLGGSCIDLASSNSQMARGEPLSDTARVASRYCDAIMMRTFGDERLKEVAKHSTVPVINGLTDGGHPVQVLTDLFTVEERLGPVKGKRIAFVGDTGSNMGRSFVEAAPLFDFELRLGSPKGYHPPDELLKAAKAQVTLTHDAAEAVRDADVVVTDVWTSMGQEAEAAQRLAALQGYQVDAALLKAAKKGAIFLHCLPAHRGEEVTAEVLDGPQSAAWDEAENRLHVQKALLEYVVQESEKLEEPTARRRRR